MRNYTVILPSEASLPYHVEDMEYKGVLPGLAHGWQYEFLKDGKLVYGDVIYEECNADRTAKEYYIDYPEDCVYHGWTPTGRVVFRGYGVAHYWAEERDWYVTDATEKDIEEAVKCAEEVTA